MVLKSWLENEIFFNKKAELSTFLIIYRTVSISFIVNVTCLAEIFIYHYQKPQMKKKILLAFRMFRKKQTTTFPLHDKLMNDGNGRYKNT